jgi:hypothetical protein
LSPNDPKRTLRGLSRFVAFVRGFALNQRSGRGLGIPYRRE